MSIFYFFVAAFCLLQVIAGTNLDLKCKCDDTYARQLGNLQSIGTACIDGECGINATKHTAGIQTCKREGGTAEECENLWEPVCTSAKQEVFEEFEPCATEMGTLCTSGKWQINVHQACDSKMGRIPVNTERKCFTTAHMDMFYCTTDNCNIPYDEACLMTEK